MNAAKQRAARVHQAKSRGDRRSYKTEAENAQILLAWESGDLSEGQVSKALGVDRLELRGMRIAVRDAGVALVTELLGRKRAMGGSAA